MIASVKSGALAARVAQGAIVAAGADVFARRGFVAATVEDILESAGIARRTFYKSFRNKEEVLAALYEVATSELLKAVMASATGSGDALDAVRRGLDVYLDYHVENAPLLKVMVEQALRSDSPLAPRRRQFRDELVSILDAAVRLRTGEEHDPMMYIALIAALEGLSLDLLSRAAPRTTRAEVVRAKKVMHLILDRVVLLASSNPTSS